jgi:hypothetical protein
MAEARSRLPKGRLSTHRLACCTAILLVGCAGASEPRVGEAPSTEVPFVVTQGAGRETADCPAAVTCSGGGNVRDVLCGEITDDEGRVWALPGPISDGATAVDVFNECTGDGHNPEYEAQLSTQVIDAEGTEITAYLFGGDQSSPRNSPRVIPPLERPSRRARLEALARRIFSGPHSCCGPGTACLCDGPVPAAVF